MFNKLKQFKDLRDQAKVLQNALKEETVTVEKDGITIVMDGNQEIQSCTVSDDILAKGSQAVGAAVLSCVNASIDKTKRVMAQKMQAMGGLDQLGLSK